MNEGKTRTIESDWIPLAEAWKHVSQVTSSSKSAEILLLERLRRGDIGIRGKFYIKGESFPGQKLIKEFLSYESIIFWSESQIEYHVAKVDFRPGKPLNFGVGDFLVSVRKHFGERIGILS